MARPEDFPEMTREERQNRYFSEEIKRKLVDEIDKKLLTIAEVSRSYQVSRTSIQKWLYKYSKMRKRGKKMIVESQSDTRKIELLKEKVKQLEQVLGQKQLKIDFLEKMIELTEEDLDIEIKKKEEQGR